MSSNMQICSHCGVGMWPKGGVCPHCGERVNSPTVSTAEIVEQGQVVASEEPIMAQIVPEQQPAKRSNVPFVVLSILAVGVVSIVACILALGLVRNFLVSGATASAMPFIQTTAFDLNDFDKTVKWADEVMHLADNASKALYRKPDDVRRRAVAEARTRRDRDILVTSHAVNGKTFTWRVPVKKKEGSNPPAVWLVHPESICLSVETDKKDFYSNGLIAGTHVSYEQISQLRDGDYLTVEGEIGDLRMNIYGQTLIVRLYDVVAK